MTIFNPNRIKLKPQVQQQPNLKRPLGFLPKVLEGTLPNGVQGNKDTVKIMIQAAQACAADQTVRETAISILNQYNVLSMHYVDEALAIGDWVKNNVAYVRDPSSIELLTDPRTMLEKISRGVARGDCDDMALLIATLLLAIGHEPYFRCVRYASNSGNFNHIYVVDYEANPNSPKRRIVLDAIIKTKPIGFEVPHKSGQEFQV